MGGWQITAKSFPMRDSIGGCQWNAVGSSVSASSKKLAQSLRDLSESRSWLSIALDRSRKRMWRYKPHFIASSAGARVVNISGGSSSHHVLVIELVAICDTLWAQRPAVVLAVSIQYITKSSWASACKGLQDMSLLSRPYTRGLVSYLSSQYSQLTPPAGSAMKWLDCLGPICDKIS